jgi:hypothetical protein
VGIPSTGLSEPSRTKTRTARGNGLYRKLAGSQARAAAVNSVGFGAAVILSAAKDLMPAASGDEALRCAQDDKKVRPTVR